MEKFVSLETRERADIIEAASSEMGIPKAIIEKDFWVCWILKKIFQCEQIADSIMFKGGTSLSKVFHIIKRFSEDIDLILDWSKFVTGDP